MPDPMTLHQALFGRPPCLIQKSKLCLSECEYGLAGWCAREIADSMVLMDENEARAKAASREYRKQLRARKAKR